MKAEDHGKLTKEKVTKLQPKKASNKTEKCNDDEIEKAML